MSYERGMAAINLEMPPEIPRTEYLFHPRYIRKLTGYDPDDPEQAQAAAAATYRLLGYDFIWSTYGRPLDPGRHTWMGTAQYSENQADLQPHVDAFNDIEEVLDLHPLEEYGVPDVAETAAQFQQSLNAGRQVAPDAVVPGGIYNSVFMWCIFAFGWEMFLEAAITDEARFDRVLEGFTEISLADCQAWALTDCPVFLCHDDIVWSAGAVFRPEWYRKYIFPRYERLWEPLKAQGRKILFCSDGDFTMFVDDLVAAGADGFIFEPMTDLEYIAEKYGETHVIIGNADCRILMSGTPEEIEAEVERCYQIGRHLPGYFFAVGNHIPYNIPLENVELYMRLVDERRQR